MSDRILGNHQLANWTSSQPDGLHPSHAALPDEPHPAVPIQRVCVSPPRHLFLLVVTIAVIGEMAALAAASLLHLGDTATALALAAVVLSAVWPLTQSAP